MKPDEIRLVFAQIQPRLVTLAEVSRALEVPVWDAQKHRVLPDFPKPIYTVGKMTLYIDTELIAFYRKLKAQPKRQPTVSIEEQRRLDRLKTMFESEPQHDS
jgi:hypothetical protein